MKYRKNLGNEFYTLESTINRCPYKEKLKGKNIILPFDGENSNFKKWIEKNKEELQIGEIYNFLLPWNNERTDQIIKNAHGIIISNPPFYDFSEIAGHYRDMNQEAILLGKWSYQYLIWKKNIKYEITGNNDEYFMVPDETIFKIKPINNKQVKIEGISWYYFENKGE